MVCPLHGVGGFFDSRGTPAPPPQLSAVAGHRCRSRNTKHERRGPKRDTASNAPYSTDDRTFPPGYGWAEPGKGWTRCSHQAQPSHSWDVAGMGTYPRYKETRPACEESYEHTAKTPFSRDVHTSPRKCRVPLDIAHDTSEINPQERLRGTRARDTAWAMSYLSREHCIHRMERIPRDLAKDMARRHRLQPRREQGKSSDVDTFTRSAQQRGPDLAETEAMKHVS